MDIIKRPIWWRRLSKLRRIGSGSTQKLEKKKKEEVVETVIDPKDVPPMPKMMHRYYDATEAYILDTWLPMYPEGVMAARLRRDLAFRMKKGGPSPKKKMEMGIVQSILGEVARRNGDRIELVKRAKDKRMKVVSKNEEEERVMRGEEGENKEEEQQQQ